jgi:hypothetical protein
MANKSAGSLEPTNAGKGKWWEGIDSSDLSELQALAKDINSTIDKTVKHVARGKIRVGKLLLEARQHFVDDQAFGKWRKENTMVQSKQHAHYLMKVAERFGDAPKLIDGANYSVLQELVLADQQEIEWIEEKIEKGEPLPTVQEVRKKVKGTSMKQKAVDGKLNTIPLSTPNAPLNAVVQMDLTLRIKEVVKRGIKGIEGDLIILGLDPDPQCPCNEMVLDAVEQLWIDAAQNQDEVHAVRRSVERVREDFKNWTE